MNNKRYFEHSLLGDGVICEFLSTFKNIQEDLSFNTFFLG